MTDEDNAKAGPLRHQEAEPGIKRVRVGPGYVLLANMLQPLIDVPESSAWAQEGLVSGRTSPTSPRWGLERPLWAGRLWLELASVAF